MERMLKYYFFVGEVDGKIVGFVDMEPLSEDTASITGLAVRRCWRGKGIGKTLARFGVRFLQAMGFRRIRIMTLRTNEPALKIYREIGFRETATSGDVVYMELQV